LFFRLNINYSLNDTTDLGSPGGLGPTASADPADVELLENSLLAAAQDLRAAVEFVHNSAQRLNLDPNRIVVGGFSAGAITALNLSHGMHVPVQGTFLMSGATIGFGHFYPAGATSLGADGTKLSIETRVMKFVDRLIGD
jgi:dienelactone hydrolase